MFAGVSLLTGDPGELTKTLQVLVGALWLLAGAVFAAAAILLFRRPLTKRALGAVVVLLLFGGVMITVNPYVGAPLTAAAVLFAVLLVR